VRAHVGRQVGATLEGDQRPEPLRRAAPVLGVGPPHKARHRLQSDLGVDVLRGPGGQGGQRRVGAEKRERRSCAEARVPRALFVAEHQQRHGLREADLLDGGGGERHVDGGEQELAPRGVGVNETRDAQEHRSPQDQRTNGHHRAASGGKIVGLPRTI
jgi:hypothetical protein